MKTFVGVSGFSYPSWKGKFYPSDLKSEDFLTFYSKQLNSVEINSSFYAPPSPTIVKSWAAKTGDTFRLAFKAPRQVTHILKIGSGASEASERMSKTLDLLGARRGPLLFQLPPYAKQDLKLLQDFLEKTETIDRRVFEFRHESWLKDETYELLEKSKAGFCIAETEDMPATFKVTAPIAYFRLRLEKYQSAEIEKWSKKITASTSNAKEVYVYLRHDKTGENTLMATKLASILQQKAC